MCRNLGKPDEALKYMPIVDEDSIRAIVKNSFELAGIHKKKNWRR
jgi:hypothetical protein